MVAQAGARAVLSPTSGREVLGVNPNLVTESIARSALSRLRGGEGALGGEGDGEGGGAGRRMGGLPCCGWFTWLIALLATAGSAAALDEPVVWRDTDTGCAYLLTPQGGIALRYRRNGMPDCPDASASGVIDDTARGLSARPSTRCGAKSSGSARGTASVAEGSRMAEPGTTPFPAHRTSAGQSC